MFRRFNNPGADSPAQDGQPGSEEDEIKDGDIVRTTYTQLPVEIPPSFLTTRPPDAQPITYHLVDFTQTPLAEYVGHYAAVLDNVLSPSECATLLSLAESSVADRGKSGDRVWKPALVNWGGGLEAMDRKYRNSDRIIWDCHEIMDRLWDRCAMVDEVQKKLAEVRELTRKGDERRWAFAKLNQRGRFLKYTEGQYFRPHCDGSYSEKKDDKIYRTHYTIHLYLNDSEAESDLAGTSTYIARPTADLVGGATSFLSRDQTRRYDVDPRAGRVLIFQHEGLYHCGDDVVEGTKYTMRTDVMYQLQRD